MFEGRTCEDVVGSRKVIFVIKWTWNREEVADQMWHHAVRFDGRTMGFIGRKFVLWHHSSNHVAR